MILCIVTVKPQRVKGKSGKAAKRRKEKSGGSLKTAKGKKRGSRGETRKEEKQGGESRFLTQKFLID